MTLGKTVFTYNARTEENVLTDRINAAEAKNAAAEKKEQLLRKADELGVNTDASSGSTVSTQTVTQIPPQNNEPARCDVGGTKIFGRLLSELNPAELLFCYKNTKKQENKKIALNIARGNTSYLEVFKASGIEI